MEILKPVSYTHLDVYKRQLKDRPVKADAKFFLGKLLTNEKEETIRPVSYTHLDVYKRQVLNYLNYGGN